MMPSPAFDKPFFRAGLVLTVLLAVAERVYGIDGPSLSSDEIFAVLASYIHKFDRVVDLMLKDSHPPGYVSFMYVLLRNTGDYSDFGIRLHSLVAGTLWVPLLYWMGQRWFSPRAGLLAAVMIASAYGAVYYSQEARAYALLVLFCLTNLACFAEILLRGATHRGWYAGFAVSGVLALYFHYSGFVFLGAEGLAFLLLWAARRDRRTFLQGLALFVPPLLLFAPWLHMMLLHMTEMDGDWGVSPVPVWQDLYYLCRRLLGADTNGHARFFLGALALAPLLAWQARRRQQLDSAQLQWLYLLLFMFAVPILVFFVKSLVSTPIFVERYFIYSLPLAVLATAAALDLFIIHWVRPARWHLAIVAFALGFTAWTVQANIERNLYHPERKDRFREAAQLVAGDIAAEADNRYTVLYSHRDFEHYLRQSNVTFDKKWDYRFYYLPAQLQYAAPYLDQRDGITYFYYLALREPGREQAWQALAQRYRLECRSTLSSLAGKIDVGRFRKQPAESPLAEPPPCEPKRVDSPPR